MAADSLVCFMNPNFNKSKIMFRKAPIGQNHSTPRRHLSRIFWLESLDFSFFQCNIFQFNKKISAPASPYWNNKYNYPQTFFKSTYIFIINMTDNISSRNSYFSERTQHWDIIANKSFSKFNRYYHRYIGRIYQYIISPGLRVLEIGCGKGELLASVKPNEGVGVDVSYQVDETLLLHALGRVVCGVEV